MTKRPAFNLSGTCAHVKGSGAWHRQIVHEPVELFGITFGKGTKHRPV